MCPPEQAGLLQGGALPNSGLKQTRISLALHPRSLALLRWPPSGGQSVDVEEFALGHACCLEDGARCAFLERLAPVNRDCHGVSTGAR